MVFLLELSRFVEKVLRTSEVRRWPGCRVGGVRRDSAASEGGDEGRVSGVSQNM